MSTDPRNVLDSRIGRCESCGIWTWDAPLCPTCQALSEVSEERQANDVG
jgi:hypothetical protein